MPEVRLAATAALFTALCAGSAAAIDLPPGAEGLRIEPFEGYCSVDPASPDEVQLLDVIQQIQGPSNHVVDFQMDCETLDAFRADDTSTDIFPCATLIVHVDAAGRATVVNLPRATYLDAAEKTLSSSDGKRLLSQTIEEYKTRMDQALDNLEGGAGGAIQDHGIEMLGVVDRDDDGLYMAVLERYESLGVPYVDLTVSGVTMIRNHVVAVRLQRSYAGPEPVRSMAGEVAAMIRQLIALNDGSL